ncbi:hypothetical protein RSOLAG22IIIB_04139 [Rhizoctonia solani]|uniref:Uncharacterized protein n=1 Tax=Rhizoctonia solani TaxID=456999 RepID=A0A0K6FUP9_9AGAM|nr:hypothetical protein RSOLAG22IIIB_04139 [Rhizoctonia solani]
MASNPSISLSPPQPQATLSPPSGRSRPSSQVISPTQLSTGRLAGNRSPNSMPSSPTSVHSSSSAIFERDIEQPSFVSHTIKDPHHISRAMTHELDAAVPSVLSAAISALNVGSEDDVSVIAPAQLNKPRFSHSRSPSPTTRPPLVERHSTGPSPPATDTSPALSPHQTGASPTSPLSPVTPPLAIPRPRKSNPQLNTDVNRLSFMSYHDLLASTPVATVPLSSIVSGGGDPGHLPSVIGLHGHRTSGIFGDDVSETQSGGEFDREGLGRGLEERLEGVLREGQARA